MINGQMFFNELGSVSKVFLAQTTVFSTGFPKLHCFLSLQIFSKIAMFLALPSCLLYDLHQRLKESQRITEKS